MPTTGATEGPASSFAGVGAQGLVLGHISESAPKVRTIQGVEVAGRLVRLGRTGEASTARGKRGDITEWSEASKRRMIQTCAAVDWSALGPLCMPTLTYRDMPSSAAECKRHLKSFRYRWAHRWGAPAGVWQMEFQRRGVPHFHLLVTRPEIPLRDLRTWVSRAWWEAVGSGDELHLRYGTRVTAWRDDTGPERYFSKHGVASSKRYQHLAPPGWLTGRWWALWGVKPAWEVQQVTEREFWSVQRLLRRLRAKRNGGVPPPKWTQHCKWIVTPDALRLLEWLRASSEPEGVAS